MMQLIVITFLTIYIFHIIQQVVASDCPKNCIQCNDQGSCSECESNYRLDWNTFTCYPSCSFGQSYDEQSDSCLSICPSSYYSDSNTKSCQQMLPCPAMNKQGQSYFDVFLNMISTSSGKMLVQGMIGGFFSENIIILDNQNYQKTGKLIGHDDGVVAMYYLMVNQINDLGSSNFEPAQYPQGQEILISVSRSQLIIWNLKFNQIIYKIILPSSLVGYYQLTQINQNFIILMQDNGILNNFAIVYLSEIVKQPIYQQISSTPTLINSSYKLFKDAHRKEISGILAISNNQLFSYGQDNKIVFWGDANDPSSFSYKCKFTNSIDQVLYLTNTVYLIQISNVYSFFIYDGLKCIETQSHHSSFIQQILISPSSNNIQIFSFSNREVVLYIYDIKQNIFTYISEVNQYNQYRFISNNYLILISTEGNVSVNQLDDNMKIIQIYTFKLFFTQLNIVNQVLINNSNLLILSSELSIFQLSPLPSDSKLLPIQSKIADKKKNIKNKTKYHTEAVNGILFDRLYDRVITYSVDGSFKVWEERILEKQGNLTDYRLIIEQFHPSCIMLQQQNCLIQITEMIIVTPTLFACLYNDNKVILWNYNPFNVTLNATISLDLSALSINNMYVYKNTYISLNNSRQLKVYNFVTMAYTSIINDSFFYAVLENNNGVDCAYFIRTNTAEVIIMNLSTKAIIMTNIYGGTLGFAKYYPEIQTLYFSTISTSFLYIYPFLFVNAFKASIFQPIAISVDVATRNFMLFEKNFNIAYFTWQGTKVTINSIYTFSSPIALKLTTSISNPEQHFFVQNTAFQTIQNQVLSLSPGFNNQMLLTFSDKISSIAVDPISKKLYLGFENGNIYSGGYPNNFYAYKDPSTKFNGIYYNQNDRSVYAFNNVYFNSFQLKNLIIKQQHSQLLGFGLIFLAFSVFFDEIPKVINLFNKQYPIQSQISIDILLINWHCRKLIEKFQH